MPEPAASPVMINAAITGTVPMPNRVPHVPVSPDQIAEDAIRCHEAGAAILHVPARDDDGLPTWSRKVYDRFIPTIRRHCPAAVICVTTSGRRVPDLDKSADVLSLEGEAKPDMASLTLGSLNFRREASINAPDMIAGLAERMGEAEIRPELEIFDSGMAHLAHGLLNQGFIRAPLYANLLLGGPNTAPATVSDLAHLATALPAGTVWAAGGFGATQLRVNGLAVFAGGHVRTGLEDNPFYDWERRSPTTNVDLVERVVALAKLAQRPVAAADHARRVLGLEQTEAFVSG